MKIYKDIKIEIDSNDLDTFNLIYELENRLSSYGLIDGDTLRVIELKAKLEEIREFLLPF